ncbi:hypothetical protein F5879DRAFT_923892 [Lentinula edodes]|nr:hypothetical protein F5879DRAFT_923892 [Lentinula edodes]
MSNSLWARNIASEGSTHFTPSHNLLITNVALSAEASSFSRTSLTLTLVSDELPSDLPSKITICSLMLGRTDQISMQLWLEKGKLYTLQVWGPNSLSIVGHTFVEDNNVAHRSTGPLGKDLARSTLETPCEADQNAHTPNNNPIHPQSLSSSTTFCASTTLADHSLPPISLPTTPTAFMTAHYARYITAQRARDLELEATFQSARNITQDPQEMH